MLLLVRKLADWRPRWSYSLQKLLQWFGCAIEVAQQIDLPILANIGLRRSKSELSRLFVPFSQAVAKALAPLASKEIVSLRFSAAMNALRLG